MAITPEEVENQFTYHPPKKDQVDRYNELRETAKFLAQVIAAQCPPSIERDAAIMKVREAVMMANAAIACNEVGPG